MKPIRSIIIFVAVLSCLFSYGQDNTIALPLKKFTSEEGLSSSVARKIVEDTYGFIWIATQDGLNRFDGKSFIHFTKNSPQPIAGNDVSSIIIDTINNYIWAATALGGLDAIDLQTLHVKKSFQFSNENRDNINDWVLSMIQVNNEIWLGTNNGLFIYDITKNKLAKKLSLPGNMNKEKNARYEDLIRVRSSSVTALINRSTIVEYDLDNKTIIATHEFSNNGDRSALQVNDIAAFEQNKILVSTNSGIKILSLNGSSFSEVFTLPFTGLSAITHALADKNGNIWLSTAKGLFRSGKADQSLRPILSSAKMENHDWESTISDIFFDKASNLWLSTPHGILVTTIVSGPFGSFHTLNNGTLKIGRCFHVLSTGHSTNYISTENGLVICNDAFTKGTRIDSSVLYYSTINVKNTILAFTAAGIKQVGGEKTFLPLSFFPELKPLAGEKIGSWLRLNDELILLASYVDKGIWKWDLKQKKVEYIETDQGNGLKTDQVNSLYLENNKDVLVVSLSKISRYDPYKHRLSEISITNKPVDCIFYDIIKQGSYYFVATYGDGVLVYDKNFAFARQLKTQDGLPNNNIYNFYSFNDSTILASTNFGAALINTRNFTIRPFFATDGLSSNNLEYNFHPVYNDNRTFLPSNDGITLVQPAFLSTTRTIPRIFFNNILIRTGKGLHDTTNLELSRIRIPDNFLQVTVKFTGLHFPDPGRLRYMYKIPELNNNWIDAGNKSDLELMGISPGTYHLQVQAFNEDGIGSEVKELTLVFLPKWYQTWWFKLLVVLAIITCGYLLYRMRIEQFKKEKRIRSKLASDLHDDLGSTMNSVKVYANLAMMENQPAKYLPLIKDGTQEAITGIRDIIWVLDDRKDSMEDLLARINAFASPLCNANNIKYKQELADNARDHKLEQEERRNLYMMMKEAVNNTIKYSGCSNLLIDISASKGKPVIQIKDDGKGFDTATQSEGNGLKNIQRRAKEIRYIATINSSAGNGTTVLFQKI